MKKVCVIKLDGKKNQKIFKLTIFCTYFFFHFLSFSSLFLFFLSFFFFAFFIFFLSFLSNATNRLFELTIPNFGRKLERREVITLNVQQLKEQMHKHGINCIKIIIRRSKKQEQNILLCFLLFFFFPKLTSLLLSSLLLPRSALPWLRSLGSLQRLFASETVSSHSHVDTRHCARASQATPIGPISGR